VAVSRVFWDTNLFIYLFEGQGERADRVATIRRRMLDRGDQLYTSALTLGEVLVKPIEEGNEALSRRYEEALSQHATLIPFNPEAARVYARLRQHRALRPPDAIQLACAAQARVDLFITNDERLSQLTVAGVPFVSSLDRAPI
jgi:predicted nucleic acid-binding protein